MIFEYVKASVGLYWTCL